ncbi:hypothetical protein H9W90_11930 [Polaribacter pectinis]|uniref:Uncharacterized protein n=1 Tax=Polaribacter pectinis TaxID=2738844 RepID=A0A7G9L8E6_9FLAO|nr:hypothetical protein [Polaribacter pectinis]QNM84895.1 hypothetical protein H9W90_11930 [Polaribacter pectinis]
MNTEVKQIIEHNQSFVNEMVETYKELKRVLKTKELTPGKDFTFWTSINDNVLKEQVIKLGFHVSGFIKHIKKRKTVEVLEVLNLDAGFCMDVSKAQEFYAMQNAFKTENGKKLKNDFNALLKNFNNNKMDEKSFKKLHLIIDSFEQLFKIGRLKIYASYLLGMSYNELTFIKDKCFKEAYAKHIKVNIEFKEIDLISKLKELE